MLRIVFGILLGLIGLYALLGILQAASLFTGARALSNFNFWASVSFLAYFASVSVLTRPWRFVPRISSGYLTAIAFVLALAGLALGLPVVSEFLAADACLDAGGSFNYVMSRCDHSTNHPYVGLGWRNGFRILLSLTCISAGVTIALLAG